MLSTTKKFYQQKISFVILLLSLKISIKYIERSNNMSSPNITIDPAT